MNTRNGDPQKNKNKKNGKKNLRKMSWYGSLSSLGKFWNFAMFNN
jgi:hypothetical protein